VESWADPFTLSDPYGARHVAWHLAQAGRTAQLFMLVEDMDWYRAQLRHDPSGSAYLRDLGLAWSVASNADRVAMNETGCAPLLAKEIFYAVITAALHGRSSLISTKLLAALVSAQLWTPSEALAVVKQNPQTEGRGRALRVLGPLLPGNLLSDALDIVRGLDDPGEAASTLAVLIPLLPPSDQQAVTHEALALAREADGGAALAVVAGLISADARSVPLGKYWRNRPLMLLCQAAGWWTVTWWLHEALSTRIA
jgi:hypothetical protein